MAASAINPGETRPNTVDLLTLCNSQEYQYPLPAINLPSDVVAFAYRLQ
jgi:hypothetical protein